MPRAGKKNAHQHNNRHENGIVAPGKRITKQKSNGHLNGSPDGRSTASPPLAAAPATHIVSQVSEYVGNSSSTHGRESISGGAKNDDRGTGQAGFISDESDMVGNGRSYSNKIVSELSHRKIDVSAMKPRSVYDNNAAKLALTVLKACQIRDTLAILTFLLSLPPTFQTLVNTVFTILTFVPPTGPFSGFPSLSDIFQGYSSPISFSTMVIIDIIGIAIWLPLFRPLQSLVIDWAQAMVATTLGGGYTNRQGGSDSTLLCMSIVSATHLSRYKRLLLRMLHRTWIGRWAPLVNALNGSSAAPPEQELSGRPLLRNVKTIIALHIVMQGLGRLVRKWLLQYRDKTPSSSTSNPLDPEANADSTGLVDSGLNPPNSPTELISKGSLQIMRDIRDKPVVKKKRKQGNYVRSQQPLWSAFAAMKATIMREYEQSQATSVATGSNATDTENLGSAPFVLNDGRIWITMVRPNSFFFDTSIFPSTKSTEQTEGRGLQRVDSNGIDRSKPFYVRINGADWTSTKIYPVSDGEDELERGQQWTGEIYGLTPAYSYQCCFVRCEDDVVIHSEIVATPSSLITEQASSTVSTPPHQNLRPSSPASPITTLKTSIAASENSLNDASSQQRRIRKEGKATAMLLKKEIDVLNEKMNRVGSNDRGLQSRQLQQTQHIRQADDAIVMITNELNTYTTLSEEEPLEWQQQKSAWESERNHLSRVREALLSFKESNHRDDTSLQTEALSTTQKRERLQHRTAKLSDQYRRLQTSANPVTHDKEHPLPSEHSLKSSQRQHLEIQFQEQGASLLRSFRELQYRYHNSWHQLQALETSFEQQQILINQASFSDSRPITPEGDLPGTNPHAIASTGFRFPSFGTPDSLPSLSNGHGVHASQRGRSTSMLSSNSVYTDFDDDPAPPPMPVLNKSALAALAGRKGSASASSGSGGQSPRLRKRESGGEGVRGVAGELV